MKRENWAFLKRVILLSLPVMIQQLLTNMLNLCDTMMIGGIGENAISAVAIVNKVFFVYQLILFGLSNGIGIFISQYMGARQEDQITDLYNFGLGLCCVMGILVTGILVIFPQPILGLFVQNPLVLADAEAYLGVLLWTLLPFACTSMISVACRVMGRPAIPMVSGMISCLVNIVLNALLIYGLFHFPRWGVIGAAAATMIARFLEAAYLFYASRKYLPALKLRLKNNLPSSMRWTVIRKALPLMGNELIWSLGLNMIFINYSFIAEQYIPAITVVDNISNLVYVAFSGCSVAVGVIIGQALGSGKLDQAKQDAKKMIGFALTVYLAGGLILVAIHRWAPVWFSLSPANVSMAAVLILAKAFLAWTQGYANTVYCILRAGGDTKSVLIIDGLFTWFGPVLLSFLVARVFRVSLFPAYCIVEGAGLVKVCLATVFLKKGNWLKNLTDSSSERIQAEQA